jgi:uroporphyrin-III C-methyltransferase/precorrin-2 dehydrogenase/sirohydrochlorin ferrochelatase
LYLLRLSQAASAHPCLRHDDLIQQQFFRVADSNEARERKLPGFFFFTGACVVAVFPAFLKLAGRKVLVVGGGPMAAAKIAPLAQAGAVIHLVTPAICDALDTTAVTSIELREFQPADLDGVWLVVAAATPAVNRQVAAEAAERRLFVNAVDDPENASVYLGGVVRRGGATIAISTDGAAPALAGLLREALDAALPAEEEMETWLARARDLRATWRAAGVPMTARRPQLLETLNRLYETGAPR